MLATVTIFCWLGGLTLSRLPPRAGLAALGLACALGCALFAHNLRGAARATSYDVIRRVNRAVTEAIDTLRAHPPQPAPKVLLRDTLVTWRHLAYYLPNTEVWLWTPDGPAHPWNLSATPPAPEAPAIVIQRDGVRFLDRWDEAVRR